MYTHSATTPPQPQTIQDLDGSFGCPAQLGDKILLLKTPRVSCNLSWEHPPCWPAVLVPGGAVQSSKTERVPMLIPC